MDIDAPVVAPGTASGAGRMASVEAGGTGVAVVNEYSHFQALILPRGSTASCSGNTTRILTGSAAFWPPLLTPEPPARKQWPTLVAPDAVAGRRLGRRDGLGWSAGWHRGPDGYQPRGAYFILGIVYLADAVGTQTRPWRSAAYPWASGSAASPAARRAHRTARRLPSRGRDAAPHQLAVARSRTTSTSTPRLRPPSAGRDRPAAPDPVGQPQRCRAAFERWGADRTQLADGL
jgi:hypothetical protein